MEQLCINLGKAISIIIFERSSARFGSLIT